MKIHILKNIHSCLRKLRIIRLRQAETLFVLLAAVASQSVSALVYQMTTPANDDGQGNFVYLDRHHVDCGINSMSKLHLFRPTASQIAYEYECTGIDNTTSTDMYTPANDDGGGNTIFLDRHSVNCDGKGIQYLHLERPSSNTVRYHYRCGDKMLTNVKDYYTPANDDGAGNSIFLDRHHVNCPDREVLSYLKLERPTANTIRYHYQCGMFNESEKLQASWNSAVCLDVNGYNADYNGANVQLWNCDEVSETWYLGDDHKLYAGWDSSMCLDVSGVNSVTSGANLQVWKCDEVTETWTIGNDNKLHAQWDGSICLDIDGVNSNQNGANAQIGNCSSVTESFDIQLDGFVGGFAPSNWNLTGVAVSSINESSLTAHVASGGGGVTATITVPQAGKISFDWAMTIHSPGQYGDFIKYIINGVDYSLSTAGSAAGTVTEVAVNEGDVFEFYTWGTTQSSSYDATFNNFKFDPAEKTIGFVGDFGSANWAISGVAAHSMTDSTLSAIVNSGGGGVTAAITIPMDGTISFDWNMVVYSAGQWGDVIKYLINGVSYDLSTYGTASGSAANIAVQQGDVFEFVTWGTTQSSSYSATFDQFVFTSN